MESQPEPKRKRTILEQMEVLENREKDRIKKIHTAGKIGKDFYNKKKAAFKKMKTDPKLDPGYKKRLAQIRLKIMPLMKDKGNNNGLTDFEEATLLSESLLGLDTNRNIERSYGVCQGYVQRALKRSFPDRDKLEQTLIDLNLENAITSHYIFQKKSAELSAKDAAIAAGIFTQKHGELKRLTQATQAPTLTVDLTLKLEETMSKLKQIHGRTIDIDPHA